jgi:hypothetical protein
MSGDILRNLDRTSLGWFGDLSSTTVLEYKLLYYKTRIGVYRGHSMNVISFQDKDHTSQTFSQFMSRHMVRAWHVTLINFAKQVITLGPLFLSSSISPHPVSRCWPAYPLCGQAHAPSMHLVLSCLQCTQSRIPFSMHQGLTCLMALSLFSDLPRQVPHCCQDFLPQENFIFNSWIFPHDISHFKNSSKLA